MILFAVQAGPLSDDSEVGAALKTVSMMVVGAFEEESPRMVFIVAIF